jgi:hypothetical protein
MTIDVSDLATEMTPEDLEALLAMLDAELDAQ